MGRTKKLRSPEEKAGFYIYVATTLEEGGRASGFRRIWHKKYPTLKDALAHAPANCAFIEEVDRNGKRVKLHYG